MGNLAMSIQDIRRAFQIGLDDAATVTYATMEYMGAGKGHQLVFKCNVKNKAVTVECDCPAGMKPENYARTMGEKYALEWGKEKSK